MVKTMEQKNTINTNPVLINSRYPLVPINSVEDHVGLSLFSFGRDREPAKGVLESFTDNVGYSRDYTPVLSERFARWDILNKKDGVLSINIKTAELLDSDSSIFYSLPGFRNRIQLVSGLSGLAPAHNDISLWLISEMTEDEAKNIMETLIKYNFKVGVLEYVNSKFSIYNLIIHILRLYRLGDLKAAGEILEGFSGPINGDPYSYGYNRRIDYNLGTLIGALTSGAIFERYYNIINSNILNVDTVGHAFKFAIIKDSYSSRGMITEVSAKLSEQPYLANILLSMPDDVFMSFINFESRAETSTMADIYGKLYQYHKYGNITEPEIDPIDMSDIEVTFEVSRFVPNHAKHNLTLAECLYVSLDKDKELTNRVINGTNENNKGTSIWRMSENDVQQFLRNGSLGLLKAENSSELSRLMRGNMCREKLKAILLLIQKGLFEASEMMKYISEAYHESTDTWESQIAYAYVTMIKESL